MYRRIRDLRKGAGLTQAKVAEIIHCSQRAYSNYESGHRDIPVELLVELASLHNVSLDYLVGNANIKSQIVVRVIRPSPKQK